MSEETRTEVYALYEGDVAITFPSHLSIASFEALEAYLDLFLSRTRRRINEEIESAGPHS